MRYFFNIIFTVIEHMFRLQVYQVILLYGNSINKTLILFIFIWFRYSRINIKSKLIKNIVINFFIILLAYINLAHIYLTLFLNKK